MKKHFETESAVDTRAYTTPGVQAVKNFFLNNVQPLMIPDSSYCGVDRNSDARFDAALSFEPEKLAGAVVRGLARRGHSLSPVAASVDRERGQQLVERRSLLGGKHRQHL